MNAEAVKKDFQRKRVEVLTLGERLVAIRKDRQVSMAEFGKHSQIQIKYLRALESGDYAQLPEPVYIKGFLRTYEHFFGLHEDSLVKIFNKEYKIYKNIHQFSHDQEKDISRMTIKKKFIVTTRGVFMTVGFLIILGVAGYLYYGITEFLRAPDLIITSPEAGSYVDIAQVIIKGQTHPEAFIEVGGQEVYVSSDGGFEHSVGLGEGENNILISAKNTSGNESVKAVNVFSTYQQVVSEDGAIQENTNQNIIAESDVLDMTFRAVGDAWIEITADDVIVFSALLPEGQEYNLSADEQITITSGVANNVSVTVNGQERGLLGEGSEPVYGVLFEKLSQEAGISPIETSRSESFE